MRGLSNVTLPGPRNLCSEMVATLATAPRNAAAPGISISLGDLGSSTQTLIAIGCFTVPVNVAAVATGGPVNFGPPSENASTGGLLCIPSSSNGLIGYPLFRVSGIELLSPLATIVQVIALVPKSFGTLITNTPHWRPVSK